MTPFLTPRFLATGLAAAMLALAAALPAAAPPEEGFGAFSPPDPVRIRTAWSVDRARPGDALTLAIVAEIEETYHINADAGQLRDTGDFVPYATRVEIIGASETVTLEAVRYPPAHPVQTEYVEGDLYSFEGRTVFYVPVRVDPGATGESIRIAARVDYQACDAQVCLLPQQTEVEATLPLAAAGAAVASRNAALFEGLALASPDRKVGFDLFGWTFGIDVSSGAGWVFLLLVAMGGGLLLNFTPCVLPVIPIKIMSLGNAAAGDRGRCLALGATMALGVVAFWLALGGLIAAVSGFTATNQLFQYPVFTIVVGLIIAFMALGMFGAFIVRLPNFVFAMNPSQETHGGSFGLGIMTAILSTPCTAPFMGAAAAWAATQHPLATLSTFAAIGAGMALPYLVLAASPGLVSRMPRSGPSSDLIKHVMGLLMLAAAAYFVGVGLSALFTQAPDPPSKLHWWAVMAFVAAAGVLMVVRTLAITRRNVPRVVFGLLGTLLVVGGVMGGVRLTDPGPIDWVSYTPERFQEALADGQVVVMDFTAEWCLNCKSLEHGVLHSPSVVAVLGQEGVVPMKVDITGNNPPGKAMLREAGRLTIPLLVVYAPSGREVFKSDFYTADQVIEAVEAAREGGEYATRAGR